jgi:hypothetical protein
MYDFDVVGRSKNVLKTCHNNFNSGIRSLTNAAFENIILECPLFHSEPCLSKTAYVCIILSILQRHSVYGI